MWAIETRNHFSQHICHLAWYFPWLCDSSKITGCHHHRSEKKKPNFGNRNVVAFPLAGDKKRQLYLHMSLWAFTFQLYSPLLTSSKKVFLFLRGGKNRDLPDKAVHQILSTRGRCYLEQPLRDLNRQCVEMSLMAASVLCVVDSVGSAEPTRSTAWGLWPEWTVSAAAWGHCTLWMRGWRRCCDPAETNTEMTWLGEHIYKPKWFKSKCWQVMFCWHH